VAWELKEVVVGYKHKHKPKYKPNHTKEINIEVKLDIEQNTTTNVNIGKDSLADFDVKVENEIKVDLDFG
jgi:hypothetical protein